MTTQYNYGTGRRKSAVARVFIKPGKGTIIINDKPIDDFFSRKTGRMIVRQPLELTNNATTFDITFYSSYGRPLTIKPINGITAPNLGFDLQNGSANVTSVTQQGDFVFRVVTDVAPAVGDYFRLGCTATDNGANSYPMINIFDTTTTVSRYDPSFVMVNPCAISRIAVI